MVKEDNSLNDVVFAYIDIYMTSSIYYNDRSKYMTLSGNQLVCGCELVYFRKYTDPSPEESVDDKPVKLTWEVSLLVL